MSEDKQRGAAKVSWATGPSYLLRSGWPIQLCDRLTGRFAFGSFQRCGSHCLKVMLMLPPCKLLQNLLQFPNPTPRLERSWRVHQSAVPEAHRGTICLSCVLEVPRLLIGVARGSGNLRKSQWRLHFNEDELEAGRLVTDCLSLPSTPQEGQADMFRLMLHCSESTWFGRLPIYGEACKSALENGAGGGRFLAACRECQPVEKRASS